MSDNRCQCGAFHSGQFCQYCGAPAPDNRTKFERNADKFVETTGQLFNQATPMVRGFLKFQLIMTLIGIAVFVIIVIVAIRAFNNFGMVVVPVFNNVAETFANCC